MNNLLLHIDYLLREHECVIVPDMGAFISSVTPAVVDESGLIQPPMRIITFNTRINHNDGLLIGSLCRKLGLNRGQASEMLENERNILLESLKAGNEVPVGSWGTLGYIHDEGIAFRAASGHQWLPTLQLCPVLELAREDSSQDDSALIRGSRIANGLRRLKIAASIAVVLALGFVASTPVRVSNDAQYASPALEQFTPKSPVRPVTHTDNTIIIKAVTDDSSVIGVKENSSDLSADIFVSPAVGEPAGVRLDVNDKFCLVVASLATEEEAERYMKRQTRPMHMVESDGRFRVYVLTGATSAAVKSAAMQHALYDTYQDAWVFNMK